MSATNRVSDEIRERLEQDLKKYDSNSNIAGYIDSGEMDQLQKEVEEKAEELMRTMVIDVDNDPNAKETAKRLAKMYINEVFAGRYYEKPDVTDFPNAREYDQLYVVGPIDVKSTCSHHWAPFIGHCFVGLYPSEQVIGLSKFHRIVDWFARRPQIQEELTMDVADELERITQANGVAVLMDTEHFCTKMRGVEAHNGSFVTSAMRGSFRNDPSLKQEFMSIVEMKK